MFPGTKSIALFFSLVVGLLVFLLLIPTLMSSPGLPERSLRAWAATNDDLIYLPLLQTTPSMLTILSKYIIYGPQPDYEIARYRPRQFSPNLDLDPGSGVIRVNNVGPYLGWDVFIPPNRQISTTLDLGVWIDVELNRQAQIVIVWRGGLPLPDWLSGWSKGSDVLIDNEITPTYIRSVNDGTVHLGSVYDPDISPRPSRDTFIVLLAETYGRPSPAPRVPDGRETPLPNQTCPTWVHEAYTTEGPDGNMYLTWHPQIDPVYWCYFHHEHGSDPSPYKPPFGYVSTRSGMEEAHEGFKVYRFENSGGITAIVTHHFGTANAARAACVRFHGFDLVFLQHGVLKAKVHLMADHGKSLHARTDHILTPPDCPNQAAEADTDGSNGVRKFQVANLDPVAYEPWQLDFAKPLIGINDNFSVNTPSRITDCNTLDCDANIPTGDQGEFRFASYGAEFGLVASLHTGVFYTDPYGLTIVPPSAPGSVRQFIPAGTNLVFPPLQSADFECYQTHPFGGIYTCQAESFIDQNQNIEGALQSPN